MINSWFSNSQLQREFHKSFVTQGSAHFQPYVWPTNFFENDFKKSGLFEGYNTVLYNIVNISEDKRGV